jgi:hypothetical protein
LNVPLTLLPSTSGWPSAVNGFALLKLRIVLP